MVNETAIHEIGAFSLRPMFYTGDRGTEHLMKFGMTKDNFSFQYKKYINDIKYPQQPFPAEFDGCVTEIAKLVGTDAPADQGPGLSPGNLIINLFF